MSVANDAWKVLFPAEARGIASGPMSAHYTEPYRQQLPMREAAGAAQGTAAGLVDSGRTLQPIMTGAGIVAAKYRDGVMVASDTLVSYGSMAKIKGFCRQFQANPHTLVAASGDMSDFQLLQRYLDEMDTFDLTFRDSVRMSPKEMHSYLGRVMYNRRSKINPLWNELVVVGYRNGEAFLGAVDLHGTVFEENFIGNGMALHFAMPILRNRWHKDMSEDECRAMLEDCMKIMFVRHTTASPNINIGTVSAAGVKIGEQYEVPTRWDFESFKRTPYNGLG